MNKITKTLKRNKKSILSLALAFILTLSFNYSPITLLSNWVKSASAYKSKTLTEYYPNTTTSSESKIGSANYPTELKEYFEKSNANFNILSYYNERFSDIFSENVHNYLSNPSAGNAEYRLAYLKFLEVKGNYNNLYDYYEEDSVYIKTTYGCETFISYVEYFIHNKTEWSLSSDNNGAVEALFTSSNYRSEFYCALANFMTDEMQSVQTIGDLYDALPADIKDSEFYEYSHSYSRVKKYIDAIIVKTVAIYSYDGTTQNNNVAGILANEAPLTSSFYYEDSKYEMENIPLVSYKQKSHTSNNVTVTKTEIFYFGNATEIQFKDGYTSNKDFFTCTTSTQELDEAPLQFRQIQPGETGYIDAEHKTYYKYSTIPYATTNEKYDLYVWDDSVTDNEQATYDSLFMNVITQADLDADQASAANLKATTFTDKNLYDLYFYVKVPYSTATGGDKYFKLVTSNYADTTFSTFCEFFAPEGESRLYLKVKVSQNYIVYIDKTENTTLENNATVQVDAAKFKDLNSNYIYKVVNVDFENGVDQYGNSITREDFFEVTTSYNNYYRTNYKLYFKKVKSYYEEIVTDDSAYQKDAQTNYIYETSKTPAIPYEMNNNVPSESYEIDANGKVIYALTSESSFTYGGKSYEVVSEETLNKAENRNFFVEVPDAVYDKIFDDAEPTTKLYYKHTKTSEKQIYVMDDTKDAASNEVYKNLNYKVFTTEEYQTNSNYKDYVKIESGDENYNKEFKLYYKYETALDDEDIYVQNSLRKANAVYIIDDSLTYSDKTAYSLNLYTVLTTEEFNKESDFYVQITDKDSNYSTLYTKLYYKYNTSNVTEKVVYLYSSSSSDKYETFYSSDKDYVASDYELVEPTLADGSVNPDYVEGLDLFYKKLRTETKNRINQTTYYYYKTSSAVTLTAGGYYAISFYVNTTGDNVQASFYLTDANGIIDDIALEHISTNGKWIRHVMFISADSLNASSVTLSMYMGDKKSIAGNTSATTITGSVLYDDIKIITINETDYNKRAIDDKVLEATEEHKTGTGDKEHTETVAVVIANDEFDLNTYDYKTMSNVDVSAIAGSWDNMFDFDNPELQTFINETKLAEMTSDIDGYSEYTDIWQYYIGRDVSGQNNNRDLIINQNAYMNNELLASIIKEDTIDKTVKLDEDEEEKEEDKKDEDKESEDKEEEKDIATVPSTFKSGNNVLKLENKNRQLSLGITSNLFMINQYEYYKITVYIFSPERDASATITLNSVLYTSTTPTYGSLLTSSVTADACLTDYSTKPTNEYSWIPITFYVEGNTLHDQPCSLVLEADKNSTVYFDNITIENISSTAYDSASSDSNNNTQVLSLTPSTSVVSKGITNGYFNNITLKENYKSPNYDFYAPKTAKNWTVNANNSSNVVAGVVPTSKSYTYNTTEDFYDKYNNSNIPYTLGYNVENSYNNVFAIYAAPQKASPIKDADPNLLYDVTNNYKIYSSSLSLSASSVYDISFDFQTGYQFKGNLVANIYYGSVDSAKIISTIKLNADDLDKEVWNTYHFYIATSTTSATVYLEIGVENASGTCFFKNAASQTTTKSLNEIRDELVIDSSENVTGSNKDLFEKEALKEVKLLDFSTLSSSMHKPEKNEVSNTYDASEYSSPLSNTTKYTVGKSGVAVATYYAETEVITTYSVEIEKVTYYIGSVEEDGVTKYKLFKYIDCLPGDEVTEIGGNPVTVDGFKKVVVGVDDTASEYESTSTDKTNYLYTFENDVTLNNVVIPASELTNKYSENVLILANSYSTDYTLMEPVYTSTLSKTSYLVLKIYAKTSDFDSNDFGLNININSISVKWTNLNTTTITGDAVDENGFVCYQTLIKTADSNITSFGVKFSLGSETSTGKGYAIISDIVLESFASEDAFNHYVSTVEDDETTVKKYFANSSSTSSSDDKDEDDGVSTGWATFFYIFSSLLLVIVLVIALVAVYFKKHPIKTSKKVKNEHEQDTGVIQTTSTKKVDAKKAKAKEEDDNSDIEGIV